MQQKTTEIVSAVDTKPGALSVHWTLIVKFWRLPNYSILSGDKICYRFAWQGRKYRNKFTLTFIYVYIIFPVGSLYYCHQLNRHLFGGNLYSSFILPLMAQGISAHNRKSYFIKVQFELIFRHILVCHKLTWCIL
jgi:hypothetical protein